MDKYYFLVVDKNGKLYKKEFPDVARAVKYRRMWCNNNASLRFDLVRSELEKNLGAKVDTEGKANELFDDLVREAQERTAVKSESELIEWLKVRP